MIAVRKATNSLRSQGHRIGAARTCYTISNSLKDDSQHVETSCFHTRNITSKCVVPQIGFPDVSRLAPNRFACTKYNHFRSFNVICFISRGLSSQVGPKSSREDYVAEDGFSELDSPSSETDEEVNVGEENDELGSESELFADDIEQDLVKDSQNELDLPATDREQGDNEQDDSKKIDSPLGLFKVIYAAPEQNLSSVLDKFVEEGNSLGRSEIASATLNLRRRHLYRKALQLSQWSEANKRFDFVERDYASRLDLIAKARGLEMAEKYVETIPKSFRGEIIYRTLLANCVMSGEVKKAEEVFNKMRDLEFPLTAFVCNQLILLYKRLGKNKIADILLLMEKENVKPTRFTYRTLIETKGQSKDIAGMKELLKSMKTDGFELDIHTQSVLAELYISVGSKEKAEEILKDMEGENLKENRAACRVLLPLYASLGKVDEVKRIWKICKSSPRINECFAAIEAWGQVGKVENAEEVFEYMKKTWKRLSSRCYTSLLNVYAKHKLLAKGKELAKGMASDGYRIDVFTWDALIKLYVEAGEVEKADSILHKVVQQESKIKPLFNSYMTIMDQYAKRGDIHNAEKMFHRLREDGYKGRLRQYESLLQAYIKAKKPAYGLKERMKADNVFPNKLVAAQLAQVDAFNKTDLLD